MSLLLDALKKAADDKQKATRLQPIEERSAPTVSEKEPELTPQTEEETIQSTDEVEELTLDVLETGMTDPVDETAETTSDKAAQGPALELEHDEKLDQPEQKTYTVSDEALSMLIYKTNRDVKQGRRLTVISVFLLSLLILASGAVYYYMDMQSEIAALERKHRIAMQSMQSKTSKEKTPVQSEIIRNLVSEAPIEEKVQYAKKRIIEKPARKQNSQQSARVAAEKGRNETASVSFQKTNKVDPIAEKLEQAWQAYEDGKYGDAKKLYGEVLQSEVDNRDALLGLGAIAVREKSFGKARGIYMSLLQQDPRDPIAIAAIASFQNDAVSLEAEEAYLQNMLQKKPDAAQLNFALGNVYAQQEKWKSAQQSYFNAWQQDIENADYIFNLAVSLDQMGKPEQALNFYRDSLSKSSNKQVSFSREAVKKRITELSGL